MTEGTRSNLWVNMREAIATLKPRLVVWENVLGALSAPAESESDATTSNMEQGGGLLAAPPGGHLRALGRVLGDLTEIGYDTEWTTLRASDIGAPHHRARVFLIAWPRTTDPESRGRDHGQTTHQRTPHREVHTPDNHRDATPDTQRDHGRQGPLLDRGRAQAQRPTTTSRPEHSSSAFADTDRVGRDGRGTTPEPTSRAQPTTSRLCAGNRSVEWGKYAPAIRRWERTLNTPAPNPTEPNTKGNPRLAAPFAEWMMGLPAGWVTAPEIGLTRAQQLKALGNGVCVLQAQTALTHLLERTAPAYDEIHYRKDPHGKHATKSPSN